MTQGVRIEGAMNCHTHLRGGPEEPDIFSKALKDEVRDFKRFLAMPNLKGRYIKTAEDVRWYREKILASAPDADPMIAIYLTQHTTPEMILEAAGAGARAIKFYPKGATTNSEGGVTLREFLQMQDCLAAADEAGVVISLHGEDPDVHDPMERERAFVTQFSDVVEAFPRLRFVLEHVSTQRGVQLAHAHENVAVTITPHHLVLTAADVIGNHDNLCMPMAKSEADRRALVQALVSGHPRILPGTDSAPHVRSKKNRAKGAYGIYNTPVAIPLYARQFERYGKLKDGLSYFLSEAPAEFYRLPRAKGEIEVVPESWIVPDVTSDPGHDPDATVRTFLAGQKLSYSVRTA